MYFVKLGVLAKVFEELFFSVGVFACGPFGFTFVDLVLTYCYFFGAALPDALLGFLGMEMLMVAFYLVSFLILGDSIASSLCESVRVSEFPILAGLLAQTEFIFSSTSGSLSALSIFLHSYLHDAIVSV